MPIVVTIVVDNPDVVSTQYTDIEISRSNYEDGIFTSITTLALSATVKYYNYEDSSGSPASWYKSRYIGGGGTITSAWSSAMHGIDVEQEHVSVTYPAEISMTSADSYNVDKIRFYIGDNKKVIRDYVSPTCRAGYENVSADGTVYEMTDNGWPLKVIKDAQELVDLSEPYVTDYKYLTFSGTTISTASGVLDLWLESFRHSDREILKVFSNVVTPPYVSTANATVEINRLSTAIILIEEEIAQLLGESSGSFTLVGELKFDAAPLLKKKRGFLSDLKDRLSDLVKEVTLNSIEGVRID